MAVLAIFAVLGLLTAACSSGGAQTSPKSTNAATVATSRVATTLPTTTTTSTIDPTTAVHIDVPAANPASRCDVFQPDDCLLPFPSDAFTVNDPTSLVTKRRVSLAAASMPVNAAGVRADPAEWNRQDGFSAGSPIIVHFKDLDPVASKLPVSDNVNASYSVDAPIVMADATDGARLGYWTEMRDGATAGDPVLVIHPSVTLPEGHRIAVGIRRLVAHGGSAVKASAAFAAVRDGVTTDIAGLAERARDLEQVFALLQLEGVRRADLQLAWSFTVASGTNLTGDMLYMRDDAMATINQVSPPFRVLGVDSFSDDRAQPVGVTFRRVVGSFDVPLYLTAEGGPGARLNRGPDGRPARVGTYRADFRCMFAPSLGQDSPARLALYGSGLLGSDELFDSGRVRDMIAEHNFAYCATDWMGLSKNDVDTAAGAFSDISNFASVADRLQQSVINTLFLGRLMRYYSGFGNVTSFQDGDGIRLIDMENVYFDGEGSGAMFGVTTTSISQDWTRGAFTSPALTLADLVTPTGALGGMLAPMSASYPSSVDQQLVVALGEQLVDRAGGAAYAQHMTEAGFENTALHPVLVQEVVGDRSVSNAATEQFARTMKAAVRQPVVVAGRTPALFGFAKAVLPTPNTVLVVWDAGAGGPDAHGAMLSSAVAMSQKSGYFNSPGVIAEVCGDAPCRT